MLKKSISIVVLVLLFGILLCCIPSAFADGLTIHDGSTLTLNDATLDLNCRDLTIEDHGTLDLGSGRVTQCGALIVTPDGVLIWGTGGIYYCEGMPWVPLLLLLDDEEAVLPRR